MFMKGKSCTLEALHNSCSIAFSQEVNRGLTTQHLFTGSIPMRDADYAARWDKEREAGDILFGIFLNGAFIGTCGLHSHREIYRSWEARWLIFDAESVGKGIGGEAVRLLTGYAFRKLNAHRIWLGCSADNLRAVKCYLNEGYKIEGRFRDELFYDGSYHDVYRMAYLENEWRPTEP